MSVYHPGDIIYTYKFPYQERDSSNRPINDKPRPAIFLGQDNEETITIPVMGTFTKGGKTERPNYRLQYDEVRMPHGLYYKLSNKNENKEFIGVIKTQRIENVSRAEATPPLSKLPLNVNIDILRTYERVIKYPSYEKGIAQACPNHKEIMGIFKDTIIAQKLNFLHDDLGNHFYDLMNNNLILDGIKKVDNQGSLNVFCLNLKYRNDTYAYPVVTDKKLSEISSSWIKPMKSREWLHQDIKYLTLKNNIELTPKVINITEKPFQTPEVFFKSVHEQSKGQSL